MGEIVTFLLTAVYAQSAFLRIREYYLNKGKPLFEKVLTTKWCICVLYDSLSLPIGQYEKPSLHRYWYLLCSQLVSETHVCVLLHTVHIFVLF